MTTPIATPSDAIAAPLAALRVLLVDDDSFQLEMISEILESLGVTHITTAGHGEQALQLISGHAPFDLMLLDLNMPDMDGFKFMDSLTTVGYSGALIIVSGLSGDVLRAATMVAQLRRFTLLGTVSKPVGIAALSPLLAKLG